MAGGAQRDRAERLRELHAGPEVLVLANAWDVASALTIAAVPGCEAIATTSAGVAAALGYPDGEHIPAAEMLDMVERIARRVDLPLSADLEAGYGTTAAEAAAVADRLIAAGGVGLNLEDGRGGELVPVEDHVAKVEAVRGAGARAGMPLVINARTDVFLRQIGAPEERVALAAARGNAYLAAGADCVFVPGAADRQTIEALVGALDGPLNVMAFPGVPSVPELRELGVRRLSLGAATTLAALGAAQRAAEEVLSEGTYGSLGRVVDYGVLQQRLRNDPR